MPRHYSCFKDILPAQDMVSREGALNLARYLPKYFCIPDLGPKMYIAYGWLEEFIGTNRKELYEKMRQVKSIAYWWHLALVFPAPNYSISVFRA